MFGEFCSGLFRLLLSSEAHAMAYADAAAELSWPFLRDDDAELSAPSASTPVRIGLSAGREKLRTTYSDPGNASRTIRASIRVMPLLCKPVLVHSGPPLW